MGDGLEGCEGLLVGLSYRFDGRCIFYGSFGDPWVG